MKKILLIILSLIVLSFTQNNKGTWSTKASYSGGPVWSAASFTIDSVAYVGTGSDSDSARKSYTRSFYKYNPEPDDWSPVASLPAAAEARIGATGFSIDGKGYIVGGKKYVLSGTNYYLNDLWKYNPENDRWCRQKDFPRGIINGTGFSIGSKAYIGLGLTNGNESTGDFYEYDPSADKWTKLSDFPGEPRQQATGFSLNGKGYVGLGWDYRKQIPVRFTDFWKYDPETDKWTRLDDFPGSGRTSATGCGIGESCYMGTGLPNDFYRYNLNSKKWEFLEYLSGEPRNNGFGFCIKNRIFYGGGEYDGTIYSGMQADSIPDQPVVAAFSYDGKTGTVPFTVTFTNHSSGNIYSLFWDFGDGHYSMEQNPVHVYNTAGIYSVSLTIKGDNGTDTYTEKDCISVTTLTGINTTGEQAVRVYPNPFNEKFYVSGIPETGGILSLLSVNGQVVFTRKLTGTNTCIIPCAGLAPGVYLLTLVTKNTKTETKVVKHGR